MKLLPHLLLMGCLAIVFLYRLAEEAKVNITNLTVRLQRLGLIYLRDSDKKIYRNQDEVTGQGSLF